MHFYMDPSASCRSMYGGKSNGETIGGCSDTELLSPDPRESDSGTDRIFSEGSILKGTFRGPPLNFGSADH